LPLRLSLLPLLRLNLASRLILGLILRSFLRFLPYDFFRQASVPFDSVSGVRRSRYEIGNTVSIELVLVFLGEEPKPGLIGELPGPEEGRQSGIFEDSLVHSVGILGNSHHGHVVLFALVLLNLQIFNSCRQGLLVNIHPAPTARLGLLFLLILVLPDSLLYFLS